MERLFSYGGQRPGGRERRLMPGARGIGPEPFELPGRTGAADAGEAVEHVPTAPRARPLGRAEPPQPPDVAPVRIGERLDVEIGHDLGVVRPVLGELAASADATARVDVDEIG